MPRFTLRDIPYSIRSVERMGGTIIVANAANLNQQLASVVLLGCISRRAKRVCRVGQNAVWRN